MSRIARSLVLGFLLSLVACDDGVSFDQLRRCSTCGPGQVTRGAVMISGVDRVTACLRSDDRIVMTKNADWVELDASFRPRGGHGLGDAADRSAARVDGSIALFLGDAGAIRIVNETAATVRSIDAAGVSVEDFFFVGDALVVAGSSSSGAIAGTPIADGPFVASVDSRTGELADLRVDVLASPFAARAAGPVPSAVLVALPADAIASLGITTPASSGSAAGVVLHVAGGTDTLVAWVTAASEVRITAVAAVPDGSIAIAGVSTADPFTIQQIDSGLATNRPFVAIVNANGSLRWAHALGATDAPVDAMITSPVDGSVFVTGADALGAYLARVDTAGVAWRSAIAITDGIPSRGLLGVTDAGNLLIDVVVHPGGVDAGELPTTLTIGGSDVVTSSGYGVFEIVR